jgi:hypothetical protein
MKSTDRVQLKVRLTRRQRDRLAKVAAQRGVTTGALVRDQIRVLTGEADPMLPKAPRGRGKRPLRAKT